MQQIFVNCLRFQGSMGKFQIPSLKKKLPLKVANFPETGKPRVNYKLPGKAENLS